MRTYHDGMIGLGPRLALGATALAVVASCGGGGGGGTVTNPLVATFSASTAVQLADRVKLLERSTLGARVTLDVTLFGPSTSSDLFAYAFDVVISNTSVVRFVSATAAGPALTPCPMQNVLVQASQAPGSNRVVVGVSKSGTCAGNAVPAGNNVVVGLTFDVLAPGSSTLTFSGQVAPNNPGGGPVALDSNLAVVPSVAFDTQAATLTGTQ